MQAAALAKPDMALEVHLPEIVRLGLFEPRESLLAAAKNPQFDAMTPQNPGDGRRRRRIKALALQNLGDLAPAPGRMLLSNRQNRRFNFVGTALRT